MGLRLALCAAGICCAGALAAAPAGATAFALPACPTSSFAYASTFQFPVAGPEGFNDCTVRFGYIEVDARTGAAQIPLDTGGLIDFDPHGQLVRLPLSYDHGPVLDVGRPVGVISSLTTPFGELRASLHLTFAYNRKGRLASLTSNQQPPQTITFTRDGLGRVTRVQNAITGFYTTYGYDGASNRVSTYGDKNGDSATFSYLAGRLVQASRSSTVADPVDSFTYGSAGSLATADAYAFTANATGDIVKTTNGTAIDETIAYASSHHPSSVLSGGGSPIASFDYGVHGRLIKATAATPSQFYTFSYGANGVVDRITDQAANSFAFSYDPFGRLTRIAGPGSEIATISYLPVPTISGVSASALSRHGATISAMVNPNGLPATCVLQYGRTSSYGHQTRPLTLGAGHSTVAIRIVLAHLKPGTKYHYRLVAASASGTRYGRDHTFKTKPRH